MRATFEQYDKDNPEIWGLFVHYCSLAKQKGFKRYSSFALFNIIRWETPINKKGEHFKVNNNFAPDYARKMEREFPEFDGFFEKRVLKKVK